MSGAANAARGEATFLIGARAMIVRPTFAALVAAETEVGSLLALVERAVDGRVTIAEVEALIWHCLSERPEGLQREAVGEALIAQGVSAGLPALRAILRQAIAGGQ